MPHGQKPSGRDGRAASASDGSVARASNAVTYLVQELAGFHGIVINSDDLPPSDGAENKHIRVVETPPMEFLTTPGRRIAGQTGVAATNKPLLTHHSRSAFSQRLKRHRSRQLRRAPMKHVFRRIVAGA